MVPLVADMFHPFDNVTVQLFLNRDVRHGRRRCRSVPVLLARREPDHITWPYLLHWPVFALDPAAACRDDEGLAERVRMPCCPRTRLESDAGASGARRRRRLEQRIDTYHAREPI